MELEINTLIEVLEDNNLQMFQKGQLFILLHLGDVRAWIPLQYHCQECLYMFVVTPEQMEKTPYRIVATP